MKKVQDIDTYIAKYPKEMQLLLQKMRTTIQKASPKATEAISYGIPTFKLNGNLVHFGGFKKHIGFFPASSGVKEFLDETKDYVVSKGTIRFPLDKALPLGLITKIVKFRSKENVTKVVNRQNKK